MFDGGSARAGLIFLGIARADKAAGVRVVEVLAERVAPDAGDLGDRVDVEARLRGLR